MARAAPTLPRPLAVGVLRLHAAGFRLSSTFSDRVRFGSNASRILLGEDCRSGYPKNRGKRGEERKKVLVFMR